MSDQMQYLGQLNLEQHLAREAHIDDLEEALRRIIQWSEAYPADIFHEPSPEECHRAHKLLTANGMTIDAFSASMGRHCLKGVGDIARGVLSRVGPMKEEKTNGNI